jgi:hypothetical protein
MMPDNVSELWLEEASRMFVDTLRDRNVPLEDGCASLAFAYGRWLHQQHATRAEAERLIATSATCARELFRTLRATSDGTPPS